MAYNYFLKPTPAGAITLPYREGSPKLFGYENRLIAETLRDDGAFYIVATFDAATRQLMQIHGLLGSKSLAQTLADGEAASELHHYCVAVIDSSTGQYFEQAGKL